MMIHRDEISADTNLSETDTTYVSSNITGMSADTLSQLPGVYTYLPHLAHQPELLRPKYNISIGRKGGKIMK